MPIYKQGNDLTTAVLLRNWTWENDGYGLITGRANFRVDRTAWNNGSSGLGIGVVHPNEANMFAQKLTARYEGLQYVSVDVQYVGVGGQQPGDMTITEPNISGSTGLTSEHIATHSNFFGTASGDPPVEPIAGNGTTFTASTIVPGEFVGGIYGAHFKRSTGGEFLGFKDGSTATKRLYYGKTHYLAPTTSFSGVVYVKSNLALCRTIRDTVGKTSYNGVFGGAKLLPLWLGIENANPGNGLPRLLLSQVNFEDYCLAGANLDTDPLIVKITYEIKWLRDGYHPSTYPDGVGV